MFGAYIICFTAVCLLPRVLQPHEQALDRTGAQIEIARETTTIKLQAGRSLVLRPKADILRTAVAAEGIVELAQLTPREIMLVGRREGTTTVTFWFSAAAMTPVTYAIEVAAETPAPK